MSWQEQFNMVLITIVLIALGSCTPTPPTEIGEIASTDTLTPIPSDTPEPTFASTPTPDFAQFANTWKRYTSEAHGISFEYPAVYDESPYKDFGCGVRESTNADEVHFDVGQRITLVISKADNQTLTAYVDQFEKDKTGEYFTITSRTDTTVGGVEAIALEYRFGGPNRYGAVTYFKREDRMVGVGFTAGVLCEMLVPEDTSSGMTELEAYFHILESFQFTP